MNKKGFTIMEIFGSILIIGLGITTLTSLMLLSTKRSIISKQKMLGNQLAEMYYNMVVREMPNAFAGGGLAGAEDNDVFILANGKDKTNAETCKAIIGENSFSYNALYNDDYESKIDMNGTIYNYSRVDIKLTVLKSNYQMIRVEVTVKYTGDRTVTYSDATYIGKNSIA